MKRSSLIIDAYLEEQLFLMIIFDIIWDAFQIYAAIICACRGLMISFSSIFHRIDTFLYRTLDPFWALSFPPEWIWGCWILTFLRIHRKPHLTYCCWMILGKGFFSDPANVTDFPSVNSTSGSFPPINFFYCWVLFLVSRVFLHMIHKRSFVAYFHRKNSWDFSSTKCTWMIRVQIILRPISSTLFSRWSYNDQSMHL